MNYPDPINQFSRLIQVSGSDGTGTYALGSRWNNIVNGRNWDGANCTAAMGAVAIDAHTGGRVKSNPAQIRNAQSDWSGGIGLDDVNDAWAKLWPGNQLSLPVADWADTLYALKQGRFVLIQGDYDQIPYAYQCQKNGTFDHAFGLAGWRASDGRVLYYDPLCKHATWVPQYVIRTSAEKLALAQRGTRSRLFVGLTKIMPPAFVAAWKASVPAGTFWSYRIGDGVIKGRTQESTGGFSGDCTTPREYLWPAERSSATLVKLTSGSRAGMYISGSKYATKK